METAVILCAAGDIHGGLDRMYAGMIWRLLGEWLPKEPRQ
jgi:hypothetical protein